MAAGRKKSRRRVASAAALQNAAFVVQQAAEAYEKAQARADRYYSSWYRADAEGVSGIQRQLIDRNMRESSALATRAKASLDVAAHNLSTLTKYGV